MSPSSLTVDIWPATDAGQAQSENTDQVLVFTPDSPEQKLYAGSLYVVTDATGSGEQARIASRFAAEKVMHAYYTSQDPDLGLRLRTAIQEAGFDLFEYARTQPELVKTGVAITAAVIRGEQCFIASVGNCRAYLIRDNQIEQITHDHTLVQQLLDEGAISRDEARIHPRRDVVLKMAGAEESVQVDVFDRRLRPDDVLVLCSDGLVREMQADEIATIAATSAPRNATDTLVLKANDRGGKDNVSVITALVRDGAPPLETNIPYTWTGSMPSLDPGGQTMRNQVDPQIAATRVESASMLDEQPIDDGVDPLAQTMVGRRVDPDDFGAIGTSLPPEERTVMESSEPDMTVQESFDDDIPDMPDMPPPPEPTVQERPRTAADEPIPAPPYQQPVQPAPPYQGSQQTPPPPQQPAYPQQQPYPQQPTPPPVQGPGAPRGYQPPSYAVDPVTGLPPTPGGGYEGMPQGYQPRVYQPPGAPNQVQNRGGGISVGTFLGVGLLAIVLTALVVVALINPFGWTLPFGGGTAGQEPEETQAVAEVTEPPIVPTPSVDVAVTEEAAAPTPLAAAPPGMALIDGGPFMRGVDPSEIDEFILLCISESQEAGDPRCIPDFFADAQPVESVTISPFFLDVAEVTNQEYAACVAAEVCSPPTNQEFYTDQAFAQHPVVYVTWDQASTFCGWGGKRLPTEAEWEMAARWDEATQQSFTFPWGNTWEPGRANTFAAGLGGTAAVQAFAQDLSPYGIYDMGGNVSEWVQDWYFPDYTNLGTLNPVRGGNQPLITPERVVRGGYWGEDLTIYIRSGHRLAGDFTRSGNWLGFRCAQTIEGSPTPGAPPTETPTEEPTDETGETGDPAEGDTTEDGVTPTPEP